MKISAKLTIVVSTATLLAFAGLIPLGQWHDEYQALHAYHQAGITFLWERLLHWSPRPLSELLVYFYGLAVYHTGLPLIGAFIAPFWIALAAAVLWPVLRGRQGLLPACVLLAMLLLGHPVAEVFYWPFGVVAYLPTLAAAAMLLALDWGGWMERPAGETWRFLALTVAAASSEVGALFVAVYIGLLVASGSLEKGRRHLFLAIPLLLSLTLLYLQFIGRVSKGNEVFGNPAVAHHPWNTLRYVGKHVFFDLLRNDNRQHATALLTGLATKLLFLAGIYQAMSAHRPDKISARAQRMRLALVAAALATAILVMAASLYNFGSLCCERHDTMRQGYVVIALGSLATYLAMRSPSHRPERAGRLLLLALLIPLATTVPKLVTEYRDYASVRHAGSATWQSGRAAGPVMRVTPATSEPVTGGPRIEPGTYHRGSQPNGDLQWMLTFFGKQTAIVAAPEESRKSQRSGHP
ncbi:MAG TPA: hypothetical protein VN624_00565 [Rhodanobacter sp.]|nr:hypothetical protein [Rhodanobacter sp.]